MSRADLCPKTGKVKLRGWRFAKKLAGKVSARHDTPCGVHKCPHCGLLHIGSNTMHVRRHRA